MTCYTKTGMRLLDVLKGVFYGLNLNLETKTAPVSDSHGGRVNSEAQVNIGGVKIGFYKDQLGALTMVGDYAKISTSPTTPTIIKKSIDDLARRTYGTTQISASEAHEVIPQAILNVVVPRYETVVQQRENQLREQERRRRLLLNQQRQRIRR